MVIEEMQDKVVEEPIKEKPEEPSGVNAQNIWKVTPINIALLKNHTGCIKRLLMEPGVDINGKDEKGRTFLHLSVIRIDDGSIDFINLLLEKGADPNI
jgi:ankyrin repeat protein